MTRKSYESFFSALSGNRRLEIMQCLREFGPQSVNEIAERTDIEQSAVSRSLGQLLECEFVHIEIRGKYRYYSLNEETIVPLFQMIDRHIAKFCEGKCKCCTNATCEKPELNHSLTAGKDNLTREE